METSFYEVLGSGIIRCGFCENEFNIKSKIKDNVESVFYKHDNESCRLHLKTLDIENINEIFKIFYYSYYRLFDDVKLIIQNNQKTFEINLLEENRKIEKQYQMISKLLKNNFDLKNTNVENLEKQGNCYEELFRHIRGRDYLKKEMLKNEYYLSKSNKDFERMNNKEKNRCLSELIKNCFVFKNYIVIESTGVLFIFNLRKKFLLNDIIKEFNPIIKNLDKLKSKYNFNNVLLRVGIVKPMILLSVEKIVVFK
jgi:hypothetical protein